MLIEFAKNYSLLLQGSFFKVLCHPSAVALSGLLASIIEGVVNAFWPLAAFRSLSAAGLFSVVCCHATICGFRQKVVLIGSVLAKKR